MLYDKSKVSIIIACKNEGEGIKKILESVKKYSNDIIVVDGHSNDGTEEIVKKFKASFFLDNKKGRGGCNKNRNKKGKRRYSCFF